MAGSICISGRCFAYLNSLVCIPDYRVSNVSNSDSMTSLTIGGCSSWKSVPKLSYGDASRSIIRRERRARTTLFFLEAGSLGSNLVI